MSTPVSEQPDKWNKDLEQKIRSALSGIHFGTVTLVVQDGKVIQLDTNQKIRLQ